jgi:hypothetical protein
MSDKQPEHQNAILTRSALPTREGRAAKPLQNFGYVSEYTSTFQSSLPMRARINPAHHHTNHQHHPMPSTYHSQQHKIAERRPRIPSSQIYMSKNKTKPFSVSSLPG